MIGLLTFNTNKNELLSNGSLASIYYLLFTTTMSKKIFWKKDETFDAEKKSQLQNINIKTGSNHKVYELYHYY